MVSDDAVHTVVQGDVNEQEKRASDVFLASPACVASARARSSVATVPSGAWNSAAPMFVSA